MSDPLRKWIAGTALALALTWAPATAGETDPARLAAFVYNLSKFVIWPTACSAAGTEQCNFCVLGDDNGMGASLDRLLSGAPPEAGGASAPNPEAPVKPSGAGGVRQMDSVDAAGDCHVLFISPGAGADLADTLDRLSRQPVLIVSGISGFARLGGMVEIVSAANRVFFHINIAAARRAGLVIKAPLLQIANVIESSPSPDAP